MKKRTIMSSVVSSILLLGTLPSYGQALVTLAGQLEHCASSRQTEPFADIIDRIMGLLKKNYSQNFSLVIEQNGKNAPAIPRIINNTELYKPLTENYNDAFCQIIKGKAPAHMLFADHEYIGIFSHGKKSHHNNTTILVIPRKHQQDIVNFMDKKEVLQLLQRGREAAIALGSPDKYTLQINRGYSLQTVPHVHLHVTAYHSPVLARTILSVMQQGLRDDQKETGTVWDGNSFDKTAKLFAAATAR